MPSLGLSPLPQHIPYGAEHSSSPPHLDHFLPGEAGHVVGSAPLPGAAGGRTDHSNVKMNNFPAKAIGDHRINRILIRD